MKERRAALTRAKQRLGHETVDGIEWYWPAEENPLAFSCGPTSFVEAAAAALVGLGYPPERVKTERFGATGG